MPLPAGAHAGIFGAEDGIDPDGVENAVLVVIRHDHWHQKALVARQSWQDVAFEIEVASVINVGGQKHERMRRCEHAKI